MTGTAIAADPNALFSSRVRSDGVDGRRALHSGCSHVAGRIAARLPDSEIDEQFFAELTEELR